MRTTTSHTVGRDGAPGPLHLEVTDVTGLTHLYDVITERADLEARARLVWRGQPTDIADDRGLQAGIAVGVTAAITYLMENDLLREQEL